MPKTCHLPLHLWAWSPTVYHQSSLSFPWVLELLSFVRRVGLVVWLPVGFFFLFLLLEEM